ncbi:MAG: hypothetical protein AB1714_10375 [Acidobacteriota bacterium]
MPRGGPTAFLPPSANAAERLVLRVCEECGGRFDTLTFLEDFLPDHRDEVAPELDMAALSRAAERLTRKGYLRRMGGGWFRVWDIAGGQLAQDEAEEVDEPALAAGDGEMIVVPGEDSRVVVEYARGRVVYLDWNPERAAAVPHRGEAGGAVDQQILEQWCRAAGEVCERRKTQGLLTLGDVRTVLSGWQCDYFTALAEDEQREFMAIVQDVAPLELLTPYMRICREQASGLGPSPRTDRYRRYALSVRSAVERGYLIPPQVKRVALRELVASWSAIGQGAPTADRGAGVELAMERVVAKSLTEVLHAIGLTPRAITAELIGACPEGTAAEWQNAYRMALREFGLAAKEESELDAGTGDQGDQEDRPQGTGFE